MSSLEYNPRLEEKDFDRQNSVALNERELEESSGKCWDALRPQVLGLGLGGAGMSASYVQGYIWGFVDGYLQQFEPPCTSDSFFEVFKRINSSQLDEITLRELDEGELSNQLAEPNEDFYTALIMGGSDGLIYGANPSYQPAGLQSLFNESLDENPDSIAESSIAYELGNKVRDLIGATKSIGIFDKLKLDNPSERLTENELFEQAYNEVENDELNTGLWARALSDSDGEEKKAKALYLKLRVQHLKDEQQLFAQKLRTRNKIKKQQAAKREQERKDKNSRKAAEAARLQKQEDDRKKMELERQEIERLSALPKEPYSYMNWVYFTIFVLLFFFGAYLLIDYGKNL